MITPRYYQIDAMEALKTYIINNPGKHPLISMCTGSGKSYIQALIVKWLLEWDHTRVLLLAHRAELLKQNYIELTDLLDNNGLFSNIGIYSAGLGLRNSGQRIMFASIQSIYKRAYEIAGWQDCLIIDEVHRVDSEQMGIYRKFINELLKINPNLLIIGLSATCYRMKTGLICEGKNAIFHDIIYSVNIPELINPNHFKNRDHKQYLCELISKNGTIQAQADLSNVHTRGGEYIQGEMEEAFRVQGLVARAVSEIKILTQDRKKILVFAAGINHAIEIEKEMNNIGISAKVIHSKQDKKINEQNIKNFKNGQIKALINIGILTEGFNEKAIDCICLLFATKSPGLYVQVLGRGLRMHSDKKNCLILDYGGNILYHGKLDAIEIRKKKNGKGNEVTKGTPQKECPECQALVALSTRTCPTCGYEFPSNPSHDDEASTAAILSEWQKPKPYDVEDVSYSRHQKAGKPDSLKVDYDCGIGFYGSDFSEWICILHDGYAKKKATKWLRTRTNMQIETIEDALKNQIYFKKTKQIIVDANGKFPTIVGYVLENDTEYKNRIDEISKEEEARIDEQLMNIL